MKTVANICGIALLASWPCFARSADAVDDALKAFRAGDAQQAVRLLSGAAQSGDLTAATNLGVLLARGQGVAQNDAEALYWLLKARLMGEPRAGRMAEAVARGITEDQHANVVDRLAHDLESRAQDGSIRALIALGALETALRSPADLGRGYMWFAAAAALGDREALILRDTIARDLTVEDRQAAQEELSQLYKKFPKIQMQ